MRYSPSIDYKDFENIGDIKYLWEINRHQHLISLAKAYYITGNKNYKNEVINQINNWIETNPYMRGVNWISALELGIRLISWSWIWSFIGKIADAELENKWIKSIYQHCTFISRNFSRYSSANNHLIGEAAGLFISSLTWDFGEISKKWQKQCYNILVQEMENQNFTDGVNKEQAIGYQQFVLDFFLLAIITGRSQDIEFPPAYWQRMEHMLEFIASIMDKNGHVPNIGDSDDGYALILTENEAFHPYRSLLATGAVLFARGDFKSAAKCFDEKSFWLLGLEGFNKFNSLSTNKYLPRNSFKQGGYFILNEFDKSKDEVKVVFDCGSLGYLSLAAHGHADALSFTLNIAGKEFLIDPGTYAYHTKTKWRNYFRGTSAHNTLRVDRQNQSLIGGNFLWLYKAKCHIEHKSFHANREVISAFHDGYLRLKDPVIHKRMLEYNKISGSLKILDKIEAKAEHYIEQFYHLSEGCRIEEINIGEFKITNGNKSIKLITDKRFNFKLYHGSEEPISGWSSNNFDVKINSYTLAGSGCFVGNCTFETAIILVA